MQSRDLDLLPLPHVTEHDDQLPQILHLPSTKHGNNNTIQLRLYTIISRTQYCDDFHFNCQILISRIFNTYSIKIIQRIGLSSSQYDQQLWFSLSFKGTLNTCT